MNTTPQAVPFPRHDIDPREKGKDWHIQAAKAIWGSYTIGMPYGSIFYSNRNRYSEIRDYALNKQSINKYKKWQTGEENPDTAFFNIDQSTEAILKTHRQKILGRLKKIQFNIMATPIDPLAKDKMEEFFAEKKVRLMMQKAAEQIDPELLNNPALQKQQGDPEDMEELEMQIEFSPKFLRAKEAEQGIGMVFYENDFSTLCDPIDEDLTDFGVAVVKDEIDANGRVCLRHVYPGNFICSNSRDGKFGDLTYAAIIYEQTLSNLHQHFDDETLKRIAQHCAGKNGNPGFIATDGHLTRGYYPFKATILDFEIRSYDIKVTEERRNRRGNLKFNLTDPKKLFSDKKTYTGEGAEKRYEGKQWEVIYKGKWIVGTDYIYDFGPATNMKRSMDIKKISKTDLSYHVVAASFDKMVAKGITEDLIPVADEIEMTIRKLRNLNNRMIINGLAIDFSALEGVALGGGGDKPLTPAENLDMLLQIGVLGYRSDIITQDGKNQRKPVEPLIMDYANQFTALWSNYTNNVNKLYELSGLNQSTDSASVNPRMSVGVAQAQSAGTNNALFFIENARRRLVEKVARAPVQRLQSALLSGDYEGYTQTVGKNSIEFIRFTAKHLPYDYDIMIEDRPTEEQKQMLYQMMAEEIKQGFLDTSDVIAITNMYNLKDAQMLLAHRAKKNKERMQQQSIELQRENANTQMQSNQMAEQLKAQNLQLEYQLKMMLEDKKGEWMYRIKELEMGGRMQMADATNLTNMAMKQPEVEEPGETEEEPQEQPEIAAQNPMAAV